MNANQQELLKQIQGEDRDTVVLSHALRLGIVTALTKKFPKENGTMVVQIFRPDGEHHRLFIGFSGNPEGDNGYIMYTTPRTPLGLCLLTRMSLHLCKDAPKLNFTSSPLDPCRN